MVGPYYACDYNHPNYHNDYVSDKMLEFSKIEIDWNRLGELAEKGIMFFVENLWALLLVLAGIFMILLIYFVWQNQTEGAFAKWLFGGFLFLAGIILFFFLILHVSENPDSFNRVGELLSSLKENIFG